MVLSISGEGSWFGGLSWGGVWSEAWGGGGSGWYFHLNISDSLDIWMPGTGVKLPSKQTLSPKVFGGGIITVFTLVELGASPPASLAELASCLIPFGDNLLSHLDRVQREAPGCICYNWQWALAIFSQLICSSLEPSSSNKELFFSTKTVIDDICKYLNGNVIKHL